MSETTSQNEILESLRAIKAAARDRVGVLRAEIDELEQAFPDLRESETTRRHRTRNWSDETRQRQSESMSRRWERAKAEGRSTLAS